MPICTAAGHYPGAGVNLATHRRDWEDLSRVDPLWAVLSDPSKRFGNWDPDEFFESGRRDVAAFLGECLRRGLPRERTSALDFGCGAGRLTRALSEHFERCVGVDISAPMVDLARSYNADRPGCEFAVNDSADLARFPDGEFDFVLSHITLQHVPGPDVLLGYIGELVRVLRPGGALVFQVPSSIPVRNRAQLGRRLYGALRALGVTAETLQRRLRLQPMRMTAVPTPVVEARIEAAGGRLIEPTREEEHSGIISAGYYVTR
jgi:SAM-dependent methyltransferase